MIKVALFVPAVLDRDDVHPFVHRGPHSLRMAECVSMFNLTGSLAEPVMKQHLGSSDLRRDRFVSCAWCFLVGMDGNERMPHAIMGPREPIT
jgi:hypothetical protein